MQKDLNDIKISELRDKLLYGSETESEEAISDLIALSAEAGFQKAEKARLLREKQAREQAKERKETVRIVVISTLIVVISIVFLAVGIYIDNTDEGQTSSASYQTERVWVGETGDKYHREDCPTLSGNKHRITLDTALEEGRTACKVCY